MRPRWRNWTVFDCNWKVALEAFNETYHVPGTHPEFTAFGDFTGWGRPQGIHSHIGYDPASGLDEDALDMMNRITAAGQRMGVPWLGWTCGHCGFCASQRENLCDSARFTGYQIHGGYAEYTVADARYCFPLDDTLDAAEAAPLLCAGLIGYRALAMAGDARRIGLYGFGAAAHIIAQVAAWQGRAVHAFTRKGDAESQAFARQLGACWVGAGDEAPPQPLEAALIFAPAGELVPAALRATGKGGTVVCAGIHMSDIPSFPYAILWGERRIVSVANLTRRDGDEFLALAPRVPVRTEVTRFALQDANAALDRLRRGALQGAAVLVP